MDIEKFVNEIKKDFELGEIQILYILLFVFKSGINDSDALYQIAYDACSRVVTYETMCLNDLTFSKTTYENLVIDAINWYYKEHERKK